MEIIAAMQMNLYLSENTILTHYKNYDRGNLRFDSRHFDFRGISSGMSIAGD